MNVSYKWLKEYVDFDLTPQETADAPVSYTHLTLPTNREV